MKTKKKATKKKATKTKKLEKPQPAQVRTHQTHRADFQQWAYLFASSQGL